MIGGTGRSGSNILKSILASSPETVALPFESRFLVDPDGLLPSYRLLNQPLTPFQAHVVLTRLEKLLRRVQAKSPMDLIASNLEKVLKAANLGPINLRSYKEWQLETVSPGFSNGVNVLMTSLEAGRYGGIWPGRPGWKRYNKNRIAYPPGSIQTKDAVSKFLLNFVSAVCSKSGASAYVADETYSLFFAPELHQLAPNTTFIHIIRDPRDVVASFRKQRWAPAELDAAIAFYLASMRSINAALATLPDHSVVTLRLEDLLAEPDTEIQNLCNQLDLAFSPAMLDHDFSRGHQGRWKDEVAPRDHDRLNSKLSQEIHRFGYQ